MENPRCGRIHKYRHILLNYKNLKTREKNFLLQHLPLDFFKLVVEICSNVIRKKFPISKKVSDELKKYKNKMKALIDGQNTLKFRQNVIKNGGKFLQVLITTLGPLLVKKLLES